MRDDDEVRVANRAAIVGCDLGKLRSVGKIVRF